MEWEAATSKNGTAEADGLGWPCPFAAPASTFPEGVAVKEIGEKLGTRFSLLTSRDAATSYSDSACISPFHQSPAKGTKDYQAASTQNSEVVILSPDRRRPLPSDDPRTVPYGSVLSLNRGALRARRALDERYHWRG